MNNTSRTLGMSAILATLAIAASAQSTVVYQNDNGINKFTPRRGTNTYSLNFGAAVGFTSNPVNPYYGTTVTTEQATSPSTAAAVFQPFTYTGTTLTAGNAVNVAVHGNAFTDPAGVGSQTIYANIFQYTGSADAPVFGADVLKDVAITFTSNVNDRSDFLFTSTLAGTLAGALSSGGNYVIAFDPRATGGPAPAPTGGVAVVDRFATVAGYTGPTTSYLFNNVDSDSTSQSSLIDNPGQNGPIAFRLLATPAPEPGQFVAFGLGALGLGLTAIKRRRSA